MSLEEHSVVEQLGIKSQVLERNALRFSEQLNPKGLVLDLIKK